MLDDNLSYERKHTTAIKTARALYSLGIRIYDDTPAFASVLWSGAETCMDFAVDELEDEGELGSLYRLLADAETQDDGSPVPGMEGVRDAFGLAFAEEIARFGLAVTGIAGELKRQLGVEEEDV